MWRKWRWKIKEVADVTGLPEHIFNSGELEFYGEANYLKGGIVYADAVTTVSDTYAEEIKTQFYGEGLDGLMRARSGALRGIVNGIDYEEFNPEKDKNIVAPYNAANFRKEKIKNKRALQHTLLVAYNDIGSAQLQQTAQTVVAVDDAAVQIVQVGGGEAAAVQLDHGTQVRRQHGQHIHA